MNASFIHNSTIITSKPHNRKIFIIFKGFQAWKGTKRSSKFLKTVKLITKPNSTHSFENTRFGSNEPSFQHKRTYLNQFWVLMNRLPIISFKQPPAHSLAGDKKSYLPPTLTDKVLRSRSKYNKQLM